jgi:hypothetical protein
MATPVVLTTGARPIIPVESGGVPMTPVDTLGEPVTVVDTLGEPVVLINNDGTPAYLAYSAKTYLGGVAPYHWLDFINNRALYAGADVGNVTQATGYSFTRASQGYYTNSDGTLTLFGYNALLQSQTFDNASWSKTNLTVTANAIAAPDGTMTADLVEATTTASTALYQAATATASSYSFSFYLKKSSTSICSFLLQDITAVATLLAGTFNLDTGVATFSSGTGTVSMIALADGWFRCVGSYTGTATAGNVLRNWINFTGSSYSAGTGFYLWGAQLEPSASVGTYVPTTSAAAGALRRGDRGVLIEGARTNLVLQSQTLDNASWSKTGGAVTANATVAPDGTTTADEFISSGAAGSYIRQNITVSAATAYTFSVYLKASVNSWALVEVWNSGVTKWSGRYVNLATGALGTATSGGGGLAGTVSTQALGNGWFRVIVSLTSDNTTLTPVVYVADADLDTTVSNLASIFIWGAQLEAASFPSSYIPTVAASATRAADVLTYTAGVSYPLSLWAEFERAVDTGGFETYFNIDDGSTANRADIYVDTSDLATFRVTAATTQQAGPTVAGSIAVGTVEKVAGRVATNSVNVARNSTLGTEDTSVTLPATPTRITIGLSAGAGAPPFGYIRRVAIIQGAGTDAQLQSMTSG